MKKYCCAQNSRDWTPTKPYITHVTRICKLHSAIKLALERWFVGASVLNFYLTKTFSKINSSANEPFWSQAQNSTTRYLLNSIINHFILRVSRDSIIKFGWLDNSFLDAEEPVYYYSLPSHKKRNLIMTWVPCGHCTRYTRYIACSHYAKTDII